MNYEDIIELPHYEIKNHIKMSRNERSAQFAPFAALSGYSDMIFEVGRYTSDKYIMSEDEVALLDSKLQILKDIIKTSPEIFIIYFISNKNKKGGKYIEYRGNIKKIDSFSKKIVFIDNTQVNFSDIFDIQFNL